MGDVEEAALLAEDLRSDEEEEEVPVDEEDEEPEKKAPERHGDAVGDQGDDEQKEVHGLDDHSKVAVDAAFAAVALQLLKVSACLPLICFTARLSA